MGGIPIGVPDDRVVPSWIGSLQDSLPLLVGPVAMVIADVVWLGVHGTPLAHQALRNALVYAVGVGGLIAACGHTILRDQVAESIGWPKGNPFQIEVGFADLAIGVAGVMCAWYSGHFWLAVIVFVSIFLLGDAVGHVVQMVRTHNFQPGNAGFPFLWDLVLPAGLIVLYVMQ
jgi:Family of unknown function (DUF6790)